MTTAEKNEMVALFMGGILEGDSYRVVSYDSIKVCMHPNRLQYNKDWN